VIEVKGSVELAPLIGLADGIVDLVATGRTLEENDLEVREEILECTARFVANRVAHKLARPRGRRADREVARGLGPVKRREFLWESATETAAAVRAWAGASAAPVDVSGIEREVREGGDGAVLCMTARFDATEQAPTLSESRRGSG